jgi:hypothetical protein
MPPESCGESNSHSPARDVPPPTPQLVLPLSDALPDLVDGQVSVLVGRFPLVLLSDVFGLEGDGLIPGRFETLGRSGTGGSSRAGEKGGGRSHGE